MKRLLIVPIVIGAMLFALPALAKKPDNPGKPGQTVTYDVTMEFVGDGPGLSTVCPGNEGGVITMSGVDGHQGVLETSDPVIGINAPDVEWTRMYPLPNGSSATGLDGCHGPSINPDGLFGPYGGHLWITLGADTVEFLWHFDYYLDGEEIQKGKKTQLKQTVREHFSMSTTAAYDPETGEVTGKFPFAWYLREDRNLVHGYDHFVPTGGTDMTFVLTIEPSSS